MTADNFCFYLQNRLIQTSQTGGQEYSDASPFSIPCFGAFLSNTIARKIIKNYLQKSCSAVTLKM
jgi:hypothetical protein